MEILKSIIPIIIRDKAPVHIGSGILLQIKNKIFILTAAHVVDDTISREILIPTQDGLIPFQGIVSYFPLPNNENRDDDIIDIAFYQFDSTWKYEFESSYKPINIIDINITDQAYEYDNYSFIGFPYRKSKIRGNNYEGKLYKYPGGHISTGGISINGFNPEANIVIHFDRKKVITDDNFKGILPLPHGISGGGIFAHPKDKSQDDKEKLKLVGIAHTYIESKKIMIGTSINFLLSSLFKHNPELVQDIDDLMTTTNMRKDIPMILGFAYYKKDQWHQIRCIMNDKEIMAEDWETWRLDLEKGLTEYFNKGFQVLRIVLDIQELLEFSAKYKKPLNGKTRTGLVSQKMADMFFRKEIKIIQE